MHGVPGVFPGTPCSVAQCGCCLPPSSAPGKWVCGSPHLQLNIVMEKSYIHKCSLSVSLFVLFTHTHTRMFRFKWLSETHVGAWLSLNTSYISLYHVLFSDVIIVILVSLFLSLSAGFEADFSRVYLCSFYSSFSPLLLLFSLYNFFLTFLFLFSILFCLLHLK